MNRAILSHMIFVRHLANIGYKQHAIHTRPLIRRESVYANDLMEERKRIFNALFNFTHKLDFHYVYAKIRKDGESIETSLFSAPQHHIGSKHPVPIMEPAVAAALFCSMLHSL